MCIREQGKREKRKARHKYQRFSPELTMAPEAEVLGYSSDNLSSKEQITINIPPE